MQPVAEKRVQTIDDFLAMLPQMEEPVVETTSTKAFSMKRIIVCAGAIAVIVALSFLIHYIMCG